MIVKNVDRACGQVDKALDSISGGLGFDPEWSETKHGQISPEFKHYANL